MRPKLPTTYYDITTFLEGRGRVGHKFTHPVVGPAMGGPHQPFCRLSRIVPLGVGAWTRLTTTLWTT